MCQLSAMFRVLFNAPHTVQCSIKVMFITNILINEMFILSDFTMPLLLIQPVILNWIAAIYVIYVRNKSQAFIFSRFSILKKIAIHIHFYGQFY